VGEGKRSEKVGEVWWKSWEEVGRGGREGGGDLSDALSCKKGLDYLTYCEETRVRKVENIYFR
jgi:hypothetical protein